MFNESCDATVKHKQSFIREAIVDLLESVMGHDRSDTQSSEQSLFPVHSPAI